jgi:hypothetical protein
LKGQNVLKKTITYEDFNGQERTEDFYFNLSKTELVELEIGSGGLAQKLKTIVETNDGAEILDEFKRIVLLAYGKKSEDGRRFIKTQELRDEFEQTNAYSELFMELATNAEEAAAFIRGIVPAGLADEGVQLTIQPAATEEPQKTESVEDLTTLSREELIARLAKGN